MKEKFKRYGIPFLIGLVLISIVVAGGVAIISEPKDNVKKTLTTLNPGETKLFFEKYPEGIFSGKVIKDKYGVECANLYNKASGKLITRLCSPLGIEDAVSKWSGVEIGRKITIKGSEIKNGVTYEK